MSTVQILRVYSSRSATTGSTCVALLAGIHAPIIATASNMAAAQANDAGSLARSPYNWLAIAFPANAVAKRISVGDTDFVVPLHHALVSGVAERRAAT